MTAEVYAPEPDYESQAALDDDDRFDRMHLEAVAYEHGAEPEDFIDGTPTVLHDGGYSCCRQCANDEEGTETP